MAYTYDDFLSAANGAGLMGEFSSYDLETAQKYPEFGLSILSLKQDYHAATTPEQKLLINEAANELRKSYGNYSGGSAGSDFVSTGKIPTEIDRVLDQIGSYGSFSYETAAPTYTNQYAAQQQALLDAILNREDFSWSKETDPLYSTYKKSYLREGDRAQQNALAQASAASGGRPSSYAVTAASQAGDYYAGQLNDIIPTLYQQAYDKYLNEYSMMHQDLGAVNTQEQLDYQAYLNDLAQYNTDRNFAYNQYLDEYNQLQTYLGNLQTQDGVDYGRYLDQITLRQQEEQNQQALDQQAFENAMAMYQTYGYVPEQYAAALGLPAGTPTADQSYQEWYMAQQAAKQQTSGGGGNGGGGNNTGGGNDTAGGLTSAQQTAVYAFSGGDHSDAVIETLVGAGYTQADLEAAGYTGDYFESGGTPVGNDTPNDTPAEAPATPADPVDPANNVTNRTGNGWIVVPGYSRITWQELEAMVERGEITESYNEETGKYTYRKNRDYNG